MVGDPPSPAEGAGRFVAVALVRAARKTSNRSPALFGAGTSSLQRVCLANRVSKYML